jgi:hypothetical protein
MAEDKTPGDINMESNAAQKGLNMDSVPSQVEKGSLTYALNAALENFDANSINYQNEPGNELCLTFPKNYVLVGQHYIQERYKNIFFLANPVTGDSEIGYMDNKDCVYKTLVNDPCLNFDVNYPIPKIVHRSTNCTTEIYWPNKDGRRYMDIDNPPYMLTNSDLCNPLYTQQLDCNQLRLQPDFAIPELKVTNVLSGGNIIAGTVQFAIQYGDALGNPYTSYYSVTNPTPIVDPSLVTVNFNYPVGKSVVVEVSHLETTGKFKYFNLAVIKTVNDITSVELVGTYQITSATQEITYTGQNVTNIRLTVDDIFEKFPVYDKADDVTTVQDVLVWKGMTTHERISYQSIASKITLKWESYRIPSTENYANELNATNLRGYLRDEIYAFEIVFMLRNGKQTDGFHIPGRMLGSVESGIPYVQKSTNDDFISADSTSTQEPYWKVYNTATVIGFDADYKSDDNYKGRYQYGEFAYWESTEKYPCDKQLWGNLADTPIRHHKFPDVSISPIFESKLFGGLPMEMGNTAVFPIGVRVDIDEIRSLIAGSTLTDEQKGDIVGFKIVRGNRGTNKSIIAKGILRNVNEYEREGEKFYYANYPYNDLAEDPFINKTNNAWTDSCLSYDIQITSLAPPDKISPVPYAKVTYVDCNNNKDNSIIITELGVTNICSLALPVIVTPAVGVSGESEYDVWRIASTGSGVQLCGGWTAIWTDPSNVVKTEWVEGWPTNSSYEVHVKKGTRTQCKDNCDHCGITQYYVRSVSSDNTVTCKGQSPLQAATVDPALPYRQVFNSPETSFAQPFLGNVLKLETVMYGGGKAHFVQVKDESKYRLITKEAQQDALAIASQISTITSPANPAALFTVYQSYLTIYVNSVTKKNYAYSFNSRADYDYTVTIPNNLGVKQRMIDLKKYLIPVMQSVGEQGVNVNNYNRETSVYLRTETDITSLPFPDQSPNMLNGPGVVEHSRFTISDEGKCAAPADQTDIQVVSYYASLKNIFLNQWGQIYSYEVIDTGFQVNLDTDGGTEVVFGGDTFINRFAFKIKLPFFIENRVGAPDESDVFYDELGNVGYPKYWHSSRSQFADYTVPALGTIPNIISYKAHNFDCPNKQDPPPPAANPDRTFYDGYFYLFAYGIPNFYVESSYNIDLRQAFNNKEGDFWPHVSTGIPDDWVQENFVSILNDNTYNYNVTYSKQNKENYFTHLPADWKDKKCYVEYPFRAVFSDKATSDADNRSNNWLTYRALSYFDFPQIYGRLVSLDGIDNRQVLARFENKALLYNALYTTQTNTGGQIYLGQSLFTGSTPPLDYAETDLGYMGTQHKFLLKIPQGQISIDAKRGQVFLIAGHNGAKEISGPGSGMNRFLTDHLPFNILRYFPSQEQIDPDTKEKITIPGVNIDNNFKDIGLHGVYDSKFDRIIITKLDYLPLSDAVKYDTTTQEFYVLGAGDAKEKVLVSDTDYFCNKSWTLSYSLITESWISFHSYLPNFYIGENNFFYSGVNTCCDSDIEFDFIAGPVVPNPPTTTTTSSSTTTTSTSSTTTTSTTTIFLDCDLSGTIKVPSCGTFTGEAFVLAGAPLTPCFRPSGLITTSFITGYTIVATSTVVVSTDSSANSCSAMNAIAGNPAANSLNYITGQTSSIAVGSVVYANSGLTDCSVIPNGWYFTTSNITTGQTFQVVGGVITQFASCAVTTTTTTSTTTTTTTLYPPTTTFVTQVDSSSTGSILNILPLFYTLASGQSFPANSGQTKYGQNNSTTSSITVNYTSSDRAPVIQLYKNNILVSTTSLPQGVNLNVSIPVTFTTIDIIKIVLIAM